MGENFHNTSNIPENTNGQKWETHFKNLFVKIDDNIDNTLKNNNTPINEILNDSFDMNELKNTIKELKNK